MVIRWLQLFVILGLTAFPASAETITYSKEGNAFLSAEGPYATSDHCLGETCNWIEGNQIIIGAYSSNPASWTGATGVWQFDISEPLPLIVEADLIIEWPRIVGKGLHSPASLGAATVSIQSTDNGIATLSVSPDYRCHPMTNDYYAYPCGTYSATYHLDPGLLQDPVEIIVSTADTTVWDISRISVVTSSLPAEGVHIYGGKIWCDGEAFLVKGIDYAPWLLETGPDPSRGELPFSEEFEDVTERVSLNGINWIPDYSGDGRVQAWEVIRYDVEIMKAVGVNTIRTYASGDWHDKNLNGVIDRSPDPERDESVQGDLPDWLLDRLLLYAQANQMKVIIGYWVQEENFERVIDPICNWDDLDVAKQAFGRVVEKYKNHPNVLAWGIGNEVAGEWNHDWFNWGVGIADYLNALNAYVKNLDPAHPILYAKYVGEPADFNSHTADLLAVNAFTISAEDLIDDGEFGTPVPLGRAYLLGEFGHLADHAENHWDLALEHAGGAFLEFNDVWWKEAADQHELGIVDVYRHIKPKRFTLLNDLFGGIGLDLCEGDLILDRNVDQLDLAVFSPQYGTNHPDPTNAWDFDGDGDTDGFDIAMLAEDFGRDDCP